MRWLIALLALLFAVPAAAQGPRYFFCWAQDATSGRVYVSDVQDVGPVNERAGYGAEFTRYLSGKGKVPAGTQAYCAMRPTIEEMRRGIADLPASCGGCRNPTAFEAVTWPRGGKTAANLLAGRLLPPPGSAPPKPEESAPPPADGAPAFALGRLDKTEVVFTVNEDNGRTLTRVKADLRGGKWTSILDGDRCRGWLAIAHASGPEGRVYFVSRGADDEGAASRRALERAEAHASAQGAEWRSGVLAAFHNDYRPALEPAKGLIDGAKERLRASITRDCAEPPGVVVGSRG